MAAPTCPVQTVPPAPGCALRPVAGAIVIATDANGREIGRAAVNGDGFYSMNLSPGTFSLVPKVIGDPMKRAPASKSVTVRSSGSVVVDFVVDTGIR